MTGAFGRAVGDLAGGVAPQWAAVAAMAESATMAALRQNHARPPSAQDRIDDALPRAERAPVLAERFVGADSLDAAGIRLTLAEIMLPR